jgi:hypothetical protein
MEAIGNIQLLLMMIEEEPQKEPPKDPPKDTHREDTP